MVDTTTTAANDNSISSLFDRKIEIASEGLASRYFTSFYKIPLKENALTLASYIISVKSEINLSNNYRIGVIEKISRLSIYYGKTLFKDMTIEQHYYNTLLEFALRFVKVLSDDDSK